MDLLQLFKYSHLPEDLRTASRPFAELAKFIANLPANSQRELATQKLLEAQDCALRCLMLSNEVAIEDDHEDI